MIPSPLSLRRFAVALTLLALAAVPSAAAAVADGTWSTGWPAGQPTNVITALSTDSSNPSIAYAATSAGLYRTNDQGTSWTMTSNAISNLTALAMAPSSPASLYAFAAQASGTTPGLWRSDDRGQSWRSPNPNTSQVLAGLTVLLVDRSSATTLLAGTGQPGLGPGRILKSTDGGTTWRQVYLVNSLFGVDAVTSIVRAPSAPGVLYAGHLVYHGGVLLRSGDGGETWVTLSQPPEPLFYPAALAVAPNDPKVVYVALQAPTGAGVRFYGTRDSGQSWTKLGSGLPTGPASGPLLQIDPTTGRRLFLALQGSQAGVFLSDDSGMTWTLLGDNPALLPTVTALAVAASGNVLFAGTNAGLWQISLPPTAPPPVDPRFADYYQRHDGPRVEGNPITGPLVVNGYFAQYFEKGRIEDHSAETADPNWRFVDGLLVDDLHQRQANVPVGGNVSSITYADVDRAAATQLRLALPVGLRSGVYRNPDGSVFVPFTADLTLAPGHDIAPRFWDYLNRQDLFPGGWLHDVGLPITEPMTAVVDKGSITGRTIAVQAFQRTVLTDDPLNPPDWQVERANLGSDYLQVFPLP